MQNGTPLICFFLFIAIFSSHAQSIGIGTTNPHASARLEISGGNNTGLLIPRMPTPLIFGIPNPAKGLMVLDTISNQLYFNAGTPSAPSWQNIVFKSGWGLGGNSGINPSSQFIGTTDNHPLNFRVNNIRAGQLDELTGNVFWGTNAGLSATTGFRNVGIGQGALGLLTTNYYQIAIGDSALYSGNGNRNIAIGTKTLYSNTTGSLNIGVGEFVLNKNTTGNDNVAIGRMSLYNNTDGHNNVGAGTSTLSSNVNGSYNIALGRDALKANIGGHFNVALGREVLQSNTSGSANIGIGFDILHSNTVGYNNIALGESVLFYNISGYENIAIGTEAMTYNLSGLSNVAIGNGSAYSNSAGQYNTCVGHLSYLFTPNSWYNTVVGYYSGKNFDMGYNNVLLGANSDMNQAGLFNCIAIGQAVTNTASNQARIGNSSTGSIGGYANWSNISDSRYKKNIKENVQGIDFIMKLRPVTYNLDITSISQKLDESRGRDMDIYNKQAILEKEQVLFSGFIAQEVETAAQESGYDFSGVDKPKNENDFYGLRYAEFVVPLVKAMQEQQLQLTEMKTEINLLKEQNKILLQLLNKKN